MHRLFHTLVVCGAGLTAVHCGGKSRGRDDSGAARGGTQAASGSSAGGSAASAGTSSLGGSGNGGADTGAAGSTDQDSLAEGPTEQWACDASGSNCFPGIADGTGVALDDYVVCLREPDRPVTAADCAPGTLFTCMYGFFPDSQEVLFNCECAPEPEEMSDCPCPPMEGTCVQPVNPTECPDASLCHCAIACILK